MNEASCELSTVVAPARYSRRHSYVSAKSSFRHSRSFYSPPSTVSHFSKGAQGATVRVEAWKSR